MDGRLLSLTQGGQANANGRWCEEDLALLFQTRLGYTPRATPPPPPYGEVFYVRQWRSPYRTIYDVPMRLDFFVGSPLYPEGLIVEVKYQTMSGSVHEKYPYMVANLLQTGIPAVVLLIGPGIYPPAARWCKAQEVPGRLAVYTDWESVRGLFNARERLL